MPNRNLQAKHARAMRQRQERAFVEYSKLGYQTVKPFEADNHRQEKLPEPKKATPPKADARRAAYVPTPAKKRTVVSAPLLAAWTMDNCEWRELTHRGRVVLRAAD